MPLEQQGITEIVVVVNYKSEDGKVGKTQQLIFHIAPNPGSQVGYKIIAEDLFPQESGRVTVDCTFRWLIDRMCMTIERVFGSQRNPHS